MSDDRQSWPIIFANKIGQQKSLVMQKSANFNGQHRTHFILDDKLANFLNIGHHGDCLQWEIKIYFSYLFSLLLYNIYFRSLDAEKNNASII